VAATRRRKNDDLETWRRLTLLVSQVEDAVEKALQREHRLTLTEYTALSALSEAEEGSLRMQSIADAVGLNQSSVSRLIDRLQREGWVERCICAEDRRGVFGRISDAGREAVAAAIPTFRRELAEALDSASFDTDTAPIVARLRYASAS
jgi:DNA-binding MarR family transcriptional regulator